MCVCRDIWSMFPLPAPSKLDPRSQPNPQIVRVFPTIPWRWELKSPLYMFTPNFHCSLIGAQTERRANPLGSLTGL
jgi:hypothetical protein